MDSIFVGQNDACWKIAGFENMCSLSEIAKEVDILFTLSVTMPFNWSDYSVCSHPLSEAREFFSLTGECWHYWNNNDCCDYQTKNALSK